MALAVGRHDVRLVPPDGRELTPETELLRSSDGLAKVVVGRGQDGRLYPEAVTEPWGAPAEPNRPRAGGVRVARVPGMDGAAPLSLRLSG
jgi:hypothetical protein